MARKINFINPFGTFAYDEIIHNTLSHYASEGTELVITHLEGATADPDYFYPKHMMEMQLFEAIQRSQEDGYDAVISGCCYDPGVRVGRELVDIPVIGPMEASLQMAPYFGRSVAIVTDHLKACEYMRDYAKVTGLDGNIRGFEVINWFIRDMIKDADAVGRDVIEVAKRTVEKTGAEAIILNCTIIAACYQTYLINGGAPADVPVINPNLMALKVAEPLADLRKANAYQISRVGYYQQPKDAHYRSVTEKTRKTWVEVQSVLQKTFG
ncbi:Asp/Glu/hydantoin racemase [Paraburkholderia sp. BL27I4N3]|uniref:aspartate/glutamate racemase family protein n=1 Tax=Paraburkholderia sp. BL27I4N3 TaxID=1938805 RepID=UPI000E388155|nr:aspartate/glutamate racemase family protein [Paraburkholderia sp. BL27I4N3]REE18149.1 Asp/Glu/hydantoin racemase [Paraburkholderia sp. BL27I4N3]